MQLLWTIVTFVVLCQLLPLGMAYSVMPFRRDNLLRSSRILKNRTPLSPPLSFGLEISYLSPPFQKNMFLLEKEKDNRYFFKTETKKREWLGFDVGCGGGRSTEKRAEEYPNMPWIGMDNMLERFETFETLKENKKVEYWNQDFLEIGEHASFWKLVENKHVVLSFTDVLHEFWKEEEKKERWFQMIDKIKQHSASMTLLIEDHYPEYSPSTLSRFFPQDSFQIKKEKYIPFAHYYTSSFSSFSCLSQPLQPLQALQYHLSIIRPSSSPF